MKPGNYAVLSVRDTGVGMDQATKARIFEPFFTTKEPGKGTGLGLSTVYGIVKQSKGYLLVDSEPGKGAGFTMFFPIVSGSVAKIPAPAPIRRPPRGSETILMVEDEGSLRAIVSDTLRASGYRVLEADDGLRAIELSDDTAERIDLLLTDVILPGLSGRSVAERLRATRPRMKVIYMSGYTDDFIAEHGVVSPHTVLLEKPFAIALLLLKVRETLDGEPLQADTDA
jgi:CheY-like chemotaxis protein